MDKDTRPKPGQSEGKTCQALATLPHPDTSICQTGSFRARHSKMQIPIPVLNCFSNMNRQQQDETEENFGSYWALINRLIKPRGEESAGWEEGWGKVFVGVEFCCPSALSPVSGAGRPWILSRIAASSHFQSGNKSGLYGPGGAHCSQCSPDGLLKGQITQRGHSSLRYVWSQHNSGGIGGLHSSMSSPPSHPPTRSVCQPACLAEHRLDRHPSLFTYKKPWGLSSLVYHCCCCICSLFYLIFYFVIMNILLGPAISVTVVWTVIIV